MSTKVYKEVLPNGLTLLAESNPANVSAGIGFFVRTGARDESARESGVSHFLEHMMFKGTPTRSALDINLELGNLGAQANAFTSEENTVYYATVIPEKFKAMQEHLSDMLRPALDPEEFSMEKKDPRRDRSVSRPTSLLPLRKRLQGLLRGSSGRKLCPWK